MTCCKPTVHPLALQHLRELKDRWGVEPTIEESIWIVRLCERVLCPCIGERSDLCGIPVRVGISSVYLWPLTIGAAVWYQDYAAKWWEDSRERMTMALGFALACGRDKNQMRDASLGSESAAKLIRNWAATLTCTREELEAALDDVLPATKPKPQADRDKNPSSIDWEQIVGEIEAISGIPCDHWLWDISKEATLRAWHRARSVMIAQYGGSAGTSVLDPLNVALQELAEAKSSIINAHNGVPKNGEQSS